MKCWFCLSIVSSELSDFSSHLPDYFPTVHESLLYASVLLLAVHSASSMDLLPVHLLVPSPRLQSILMNLHQGFSPSSWTFSQATSHVHSTSSLHFHEPYSRLQLHGASPGSSPFSWTLTQAPVHFLEPSPSLQSTFMDLHPGYSPSSCTFTQAPVHYHGPSPRLVQPHGPSPNLRSIIMDFLTSFSPPTWTFFQIRDYLHGPSLRLQFVYIDFHPSSNPYL